MDSPFRTSSTHLTDGLCTNKAVGSLNHVTVFLLRRYFGLPICMRGIKKKEKTFDDLHEKLPEKSSTSITPMLCNKSFSKAKPYPPFSLPNLKHQSPFPSPVTLFYLTQMVSAPSNMPSCNILHQDFILFATVIGLLKRENK